MGKNKMIPIYQKPKKHIIVCVNERKESDCCKNVNGIELFYELKNFVISNGLAGSVWITKSGCLGFCNNIGTTVMIYPEGKLFTEVKKEDYKNIIELI